MREIIGLLNWRVQWNSGCTAWQAIAGHPENFRKTLLTRRTRRSRRTAGGVEGFSRDEPELLGKNLKTPPLASRAAVPKDRRFPKTRSPPLRVARSQRDRVFSPFSAPSACSA